MSRTFWLSVFSLAALALFQTPGWRGLLWESLSVWWLLVFSSLGIMIDLKDSSSHSPLSYVILRKVSNFLLASLSKFSRPLLMCHQIQLVSQSPVLSWPLRFLSPSWVFLSNFHSLCFRLESRGTSAGSPYIFFFFHFFMVLFSLWYHCHYNFND